MNFTNEQLAFIGTLMYCERITDARENLETRLGKMFYNCRESDIDKLKFDASPDRFGYPENLEKFYIVIKCQYSDPNRI